MERLGNILVQKGHSVSMLINSNYGKFRPRAHEEPIPPLDLVVFTAPQGYTPVCEFDTIEYSLFSPIKERFNIFIETAAKYCEMLVKDLDILQRLKRENYDLFIIEAVDPCSRVLADYLDVPFIPLITTGLGHCDGNPRPPSYVPATLADYTPTMTFVERLSNLLMKFKYEFIPVLMRIDSRFEQLKMKYNLNTSLSIASTFNKASVKLVNSDFSLEFLTPIEPDTVMVGGFAIRSPTPLDADLEEFLDSSGPHGVIVFSLGTIVKSYSQHWTRFFAEIFSQLPQKVLWRNTQAVENVTLDRAPNVRLMKWLPQAALLAHPKVRLFITHCGLNSALEAVHFGVPVVAMPMFADQYSHAAKLTKHARMGIQVDLHSITHNAVLDAVRTVLADPSYQQNARVVSKRFHDQPVAPKDKLVFWVEYVLRHKGAYHLKSVAHKLTWYQYLSLDVFTCMLIIIVATVKVLMILSQATLHLARQVVKLPWSSKSKVI